MTAAVLTRNDASVRILTLNRPERMNALNLDDRIELLDALRDADEDPNCRAIVLTGNDQIFSAGGDISSMSGTDIAAARKRLEIVGEVAQQLVQSQTPVVAAVEGGAYGLGLSLTCATDLVVAASGSKYCASFGKIGLIADTGLFYTLPKRVGTGRARRLLLTAETVPAEEALEYGLVDEITPPGHTLARAIEIAQLLASRSAPVIAATRQILAQSDQSLESILEAETEHQLESLMGPDFEEGKTAFFERRDPKFNAIVVAADSHAHSQ